MSFFYMPHLYIYGGGHLYWFPGPLSFETETENNQKALFLNPVVTTHPLDNPVWSALTSRQANLALGGKLAKRYPPTMAAIAAVSTVERAAFDELAALITFGEVVYLAGFELSDIEPQLPPSLKAKHQLTVIQMVYSGSGSVARHEKEISVLSQTDVPEMLNLVALAQPGPFLGRTYEMGRYFGIPRQGQLVAMAGERIVLEGYREISTICTHPDFQGHGYARQLVGHLVDIHLKEGNTPFLHVIPDNERAKAIYESLGFMERRRIPLIGLQRADMAQT